jgi:hypothetical protein
MANPGFDDKRPAQRPPIENQPAPANDFGSRGVTTGTEAAVRHEQSPGNYGRKE